MVKQITLELYLFPFFVPKFGEEFLR